MFEKIVSSIKDCRAMSIISLLGICYILCTSSSVCVAPGCEIPLGATPPRKKKFLRKRVAFFSLFFVFPRFLCPLLGFFSAHGFLPMVFYFRLRN
jgi:hypothetical protein